MTHKLHLPREIKLYSVDMNFRSLVSLQIVDLWGRGELQTANAKLAAPHLLRGLVSFESFGQDVMVAHHATI